MNSPEEIPGLADIAAQLGQPMPAEVQGGSVPPGWSDAPTLPVAEEKPAEEKPAEEVPAKEEEKKKEYTSYQEYIDAGEDPEYFQGAKVRQKIEDLTKKTKSAQTERNETNQILRDLQSAQIKADERHNDEQHRQKIFHEEQMKQAEKDDDLDAFKIAQRQHAAIPEREEVRQPQQPQGEAQVFRDLRASDARLDRHSDSFNPSYNRDFEEQVNFMMNDLSHQNGGRKLSDIEMNHVVEKVKGQLNGDERNAAQYQPNPNRERPSAVITPKVSAAKSTDPMSKMTPEHKTLYDQWINGSADQQGYAKQLLGKYK